MTAFQIHRHEDDNPEEDDMIPEFICLASISLAATYLSAGGDPSMLAVPGAMLASLVALMKAAHEKRAWQDRASAVIGTSVVGSTAPSALIHWFWPEAIPKMIWQTWGLMGFLGGLLGWMIAYAFVKVVGIRSEKFADGAVRRFARRYLPDDQDSKDGRGGQP